MHKKIFFLWLILSISILHKVIFESWIARSDHKTIGYRDQSLFFSFFLRYDQKKIILFLYKLKKKKGDIKIIGFIYFILIINFFFFLSWPLRI